mmetsp:Transcript_40575/g.79370  ORF Transcript_40575/g.79370 Transcript_40575/m.79370 type:complete len:110 (-) Transcript_40575:48-377(-)
MGATISQGGQLYAAKSITTSLPLVTVSIMMSSISDSDPTSRISPPLTKKALNIPFLNMRVFELCIFQLMDLFPCPKGANDTNSINKAEAVNSRCPVFDVSIVDHFIILI